MLTIMLRFACPVLKCLMRFPKIVSFVKVPKSSVLIVVDVSKAKCRCLMFKNPHKSGFVFYLRCYAVFSQQSQTINVI